jgi:hypothetical protein
LELRLTTHLGSWRVDSFDALPATVQEWVKTDAELWREPPQDLEEIRELQTPAPEPQE